MTLSFLVAASALAAAPPDFAYAFTNAPGTHLLALDALEHPERLTKVSCDGTVLDVKFSAVQPKGPNDTGRQTSRSFDQSPGARFTVVKGTVPDNVVCLLGTEAFFAPRTFVPVTKTELTPCDAATRAQAEKLGARKVRTCLAVATFPGGRLFFTLFVRKGADLLAGVLLLTDKSAPALRSFPAKYEKDSPSCWRADDGCEFTAEAYRVPFVMNGKAGLELFATWAGPEGENVELLTSEGPALKPSSSSSRYWSPE